MCVNVVVVIIKLQEHTFINQSLAKVNLIFQGMVGKVFYYLVSFLIWLFSFSFLLFIILGTNGYENWDSGIFWMFVGSLGDIPFTEISGTTPFWGSVIGVGVAFILILLFLNLLIAVMSEAIEEVAEDADSIWAVGHSQRIKL